MLLLKQFFAMCYTIAISFNAFSALINRDSYYRNIQSCGRFILWISAWGKYQMINALSTSKPLSRFIMRRAHLRIVSFAVLVFLCVAWLYALEKMNILQAAMDWTKQEEEEESRDFIIPNDENLTNMTNKEWQQIYWTYINRLQTLCKDVVRVGTLKDGGKDICIDEPYRPRAPCIIYSFGIHTDFAFSNAAVNMFGCDVYCFNPSMKKASQRISEHVWFYNWGLSGENTVNTQGWTMRTLGAIRNELGHSNKSIDLLNMDIEGYEWRSLLQMIPAGYLDDVRQVAMETHFGYGGVPHNSQLSALRQLYETGFRIFMRDRNAWVEGFITTLNQISLINIF